jgi:hypothetical protein
VLSLVAILAVPAIGVVLQVVQSRRRQPPNWVSLLGLGATLLFVLVGLPAAVAGDGAQFTLTNPSPDVSISFVATASGYTILGLSVVAALILLVQEDAERSSTLLLSVAGVAVACLGGSLFTLACGAEIVAFSALIRGRAQGSTQLRYWLELVVTQAAVACLIGAACWYQLQVSTTSLSVLPSAAANVASLTWCVGIVLLAFACALASAARSKGLAHAEVGLGSLLVLNVVRLDQIANAGLTAGPAATLVAGGCVLGVIALVQTWRASTLADCAHWLWATALVPLLFVGAEVQDATGTALGALTFTLLVSGVLLALITTREKLGISKSLGVLAVVGLPFGSVLPGWISSGFLLAGTSSWRILAWILIGFGVLYVVAGVRMAVLSRESGLVWRPRNIALLGVGAYCVAASLLPGLLATSVFAWIADNSVTSTPVFDLPVAGSGTWPGGLVALLSLLLFAMAFSSATILGKSLGTAATSADVSDISTTSERGRLGNLLNKLGGAVSNVDDWLGPEPRLVTVVLAGAVALAVFR